MRDELAQKSAILCTIMKSSYIKFVSVFIFHLALFLGFYGIVTLIPSLVVNYADMWFAGAFSLIYFFLMWNDLYYRPYHHYLKRAFPLIFRNLLLSFVMYLILEYTYYTFLSELSAHHVIEKGLILVSFYALMQSLQYFWITHLARLGFFRKNVMLVGSYDERIPVESLFQNINNTKNFCGQLLRLDGVWHYRPSLEETPVPLRKSLSAFLFSCQVNELIICMDSSLGSDSLSECARWCHDHSIGYYLIPDISLLPHTSPWHKRFSAIPSVERFCPNRDSLIMLSIKRLIDIAGSIFGLIVFGPLMLVIAALIKKEDGGKVFYVSERVGIHGKTIRFAKFRSMVPDAEALKKDLLDLNERPDGPLFKLTNDPRVTKIGAFLRKTSLDELPQFWNVLRGDMSLVGPRPHLPSEVEAYSDIDHLRLECIPGISCLPQIVGRDTLGFREWVDLDLEYRKNWSLLYDFRIMFKTIHVVLAHRAK